MRITAQEPAGQSDVSIALAASGRGSGQEVSCFLVDNSWPPPRIFISGASKGFRVLASGLESTLASISVSVDSKDS